VKVRDDPLLPRAKKLPLCKASSLPCYSIHGSVYIFDLSLLGSALAPVKFMFLFVKSLF
jgi:hypothetical protein